LQEKIQTAKQQEAEAGDQRHRSTMPSTTQRYTAGLLAAAGKFHLSSQVCDYVQKKTANLQQKEYNKNARLKMNMMHFIQKCRRYGVSTYLLKGGIRHNFERW
jgi:hypothetical protein